MNDTEREALKSAMRLPYPSFPCLHDKRPACPTGFKAATTGEAGLATLWARHPGELVGVPTGPASGLAVLDIDVRNGGRAWWEANKARVPETRMHRTRSGGLHVLFHHEPGLRNSAGKIAPGIDVRGDGGYIVWWAAAGLGVRDAPLAAWPHWLSPKPSEPRPPPPPMTRKPDRPLAREIEDGLLGVARRLERSTEGERNQIAFWAACRAGEYVRAGGLDPNWGRDLLLLAAQRAGLPATEARQTIENGLRRAS